MTNVRNRKYFKEKDVDAIFIINCNFGNEEAAGKIAQMIGKPVLLWGPRDTIFCEDGTRYTDTQCGLFSISKQLKRYGIPFSYIENCNIEDKAFDIGLRQFMSVVCMVKNFYKLRIVQVGARVKPFKSVMINEMELMERFGIDIVPVNMAEAIDKLNKIYNENTEQLRTDAEEIKKKIDTSSISDELLVKMMALYIFIGKLMKKTRQVLFQQNLDIYAACFGAMPCLAMSILQTWVIS